MKIIKYILTILICYIMLILISKIIGKTTTAIIGLSAQRKIIFIFVGLPTIWYIFGIITDGFMMILDLVSPSRTFSFWTILLFTIINSVPGIIGSWSMDVNYDNNIIFSMIVFDLMVLSVTFSIIMKAYFLKNVAMME